MRKRWKRNDDDINYWQSQSDMLTALILILILVILLLVLYLIQAPEEDFIDMWEGDTFGEETTEGTTEMYFWGREEDSPDSGEGGGAPVLSPTPTPTPSPTITPGGGGDGGGGGGGGDEEDDEEDRNEFPEEGEKSAVFVMVIDGDTERTIKESGITFELYGPNETLMTLNTYYPERITFRDFSTTESGTFYLPEKIHQGTYSFHDVTEPKGYSLAENQEFYVEDYYDWEEPFVVRIPVYPARNVIRLQMLDAADGSVLSGGTFEVTAAEDIITPDGTLRYRLGELVSVIECDEFGYGESEELYLGNYTLTEVDIPEYYASIEGRSFEMELMKKTQADASVTSLESERTEFTLTLTDELYPTKPIANVPFAVSYSGAQEGSEVLYTDLHGQIVLNELLKNTSYRIRQVKSVGEYYPDEEEYRFLVTGDGRIDGEGAATSLDLTNWILRVKIGVIDALLHTQVSDVSLSLYDSQDQLVRSWTSMGSAIMISDIDEGEYYVTINGDTSKKYPINVQNRKEIQELNVRLFSLMSLAITGGILLLLSATAFAVYSSHRKQQAKKRAEKELQALRKEKQRRRRSKAQQK